MELISGKQYLWSTSMLVLCLLTICVMLYSAVLTEHQLMNAINTLCSLVTSTDDKVVCSKVFRCLAVQSLPRHIVTAQVTTQVNCFVAACMAV